jgi:predicted enzyme related to lactoylglutathione lyase
MLTTRKPGAIVVVSCLALVAGCAQDGDMAQNNDQAVGDNPELLVLYEQDQADRSADSIDWAAVGPRDSVRREKVLEMVNSDELRTSEDYRHAAMVFQHGSDTTAARLAHDLARQAVALDSMNADARWLMAAAWDRYQMRLGVPQWYGTQYVMDDEDGWRLYAIDTTAVSEQEREWLGAPMMEELRERLEEPNRSGAAPATSEEEDLMSQAEQDLRVDYVEFPTTDMGETKLFYAGVFGWKITDYGPDYASFEDGRLAGGFRAEPAVATGGPLVVIYAVNLEEVESAIRENGGRIVREVFEFPGGRRFHFTDPSGNELAVWSDR